MIPVQVLDHGYVTLIESWGSDARIVESARRSTAKGFQGWGPRCTTCKTYRGRAQLGTDMDDICCPHCGGAWETEPGDEKLLKYLWDHAHATPFEMAGMTIEVKAPIMVFRVWHRHRTQCLAPDTLIHFDLPRHHRSRSRIYKMRIDEIWRKWQPTKRSARPERQVNALWPRSRIQEMHLRCLDEEAREIGHTRIVAVIAGDSKPMVRVTTTSGRALTATREHRVFTSTGWMPLGEAIDHGALLVLEGTTRSMASCWEVPAPPPTESWRPVIGWETQYEVSDAGRVRRTGCEPKRTTRAISGYAVVSLNRPGEQATRTVHRLVLEAFVGACPDGFEARHKNHNRLDASLANLEWGSSQDNSADMRRADRQQRLVPGYEEIVVVEDAGMQPSYDLMVEGPWHNFVADGFVVHNSYNEMSARYIPLPNENYVPSVERVLVSSKSNKQAGTAAGAQDLTPLNAEIFTEKLQKVYANIQQLYEEALHYGVPKELARLPVPVGRYSVMRATANLRNWLGFLKLRCDKAAQWEIRQYANTVAGLVQESFPRTYEVARESVGMP